MRNIKNIGKKAGVILVFLTLISVVGFSGFMDFYWKEGNSVEVVGYIYVDEVLSEDRVVADWVLENATPFNKYSQYHNISMSNKAQSNQTVSLIVSGDEELNTYYSLTPYGTPITSIELDKEGVVVDFYLNIEVEHNATAGSYTSLWTIEELIP